MKNLLKYIVIGLLLIFAATVIAPMVIGILIGGAIFYGGYKVCEKNESVFMKIIGLLLITLGIVIAFSSIPVLLLLGATIIGYYVYKYFKGEDQIIPASSPFSNFEKEWQNLKK
jgi:lia operon protein LiaI